jgi:hypothetical protein
MAAPRTWLQTLFDHEGDGVLARAMWAARWPRSRSLSGQCRGKVGPVGWAGPVAQRGFGPQDIGNFEILFYFQNIYSLQIH